MKRPTSINFNPPILEIGDKAYCVCGPHVYGKEAGEEVEILDVKHMPYGTLYLVVYDNEPKWIGWQLFWDLEELSAIENTHELSRPHSIH